MQLPVRLSACARVLDDAFAGIARVPTISQPNPEIAVATVTNHGAFRGKRSPLQKLARLHRPGPTLLLGHSGSS